MKDKLPTHIAIIMDGNGRWARKHNLPRIEGHRKGILAIRRTVEAANELGIKYLSLFAFSIENWKRSKEEVNNLMNLFRRYIKKEAEKLHKKNVKLLFCGRIKELPEDIYKQMKEAMEKTANNTGLVLNIALNYSGRIDIIDAVKKIIKDIKENKLIIDDLSEEVFEKYLYTYPLPAPDLLIRTSGELRISNFFLWQAAYTELWITPILWPDFKKEHLLAAIEDYKKRERRFGGN